MPRLPRLYIKGAVYYITCRGEDNQDIFKDERDYQMFLDFLKKYKEQYGIKIFAFSLMPNHLHLLVEMTKLMKAPEQDVDKSQELSDFMHNLNNGYTKYFNSRYERKGHLFRERFKASIIEKDPYLLKMTAYVHLNPKRLNMAIETQDYPYSSYSLYLYNKAIAKDKGLDLQQEMNEVFGLLGNQDYANFVGGMTKELGDFIHKNLQRGGALGSEEFIKEIKSQVKAYHEKTDSDTIQDTKKHKLVFTAGGILLVFIMSVGGVYFYAMNQKAKEAEIAKPQINPVEKKVKEYKLEEWDIKLIPTSGGSVVTDTLLFGEGKFASTKLNTKGFSGSNYSITIESNGKIVWETMQSCPDGVASWRGEINQDKMTGVLSLRQKGEAPQDFSFISTGYRRK